MAAKKQARILLVEDEDSLRHTLKLNFELEGHQVTTATDGPEALDRARNAHFDLLVLDVMLPELDGFTVCETLRVEGNATPALFLTARDSSEDRIRGLRTGDDHLGKPFDLQELLLRVQNLLDRSQQREQLPQREFTIGSARVDLASYEVTDQQGKVHSISKREAKLLRLLLKKEGKVVSREEILQKVWGYDVYPSTRTIDNYIVAFRKYFEKDPKRPQHFLSVRGVGYKFAG